jgi:LysR family transcriptional regulator, glycine cleavage system transcriptional activator
VLLHTDNRDGWARWLEEAGGGACENLASGPVFNQASMAIDAAIDGQGIALARSALAAWDIRAARLVRPFPLALKVPYAYWVVCPKSNADLPKIATFRKWLLSEAAEDGKRMREP